MDKITLSNAGTYKEIEYLKKTLGPVLVSALSEVCIKRPADPVEFLGQWLVRWRYNEELRRRDMQNALEVVRQRQTTKCERQANVGQCPLPLDPYGEGVLKHFPFLPPGYGGPITEADLRTLDANDGAAEDEEEEEQEDELGEEKEEDVTAQEYDYETGGEDYGYNMTMEIPGEEFYENEILPPPTVMASASSQYPPPPPPPPETQVTDTEAAFVGDDNPEDLEPQ